MRNPAAHASGAYQMEQPTPLFYIVNDEHGSPLISYFLDLDLLRICRLFASALELDEEGWQALRYDEPVRHAPTSWRRELVCQASKFLRTLAHRFFDLLFQGVRILPGHIVGWGIRGIEFLFPVACRSCQRRLGFRRGVSPRGLCPRPTHRGQ